MKRTRSGLARPSPPPPTTPKKKGKKAAANNEVIPQPSPPRSTSNNATTSPISPKVVQVVDVKIPKFQPENVELWFANLELQFKRKRIIKDERKYDDTLSALAENQQVFSRFTQLIRFPPLTDKYETLKKAVFEKYALSEEEKAEKLLNISSLGDQTPMELLDKMISLQPFDEDNSESSLFKRLFMRAMPPEIKSHLVPYKDAPIQVIAKEAEKHFLKSGALVNPNVNAVTSARAIEDQPQVSAEVNAVGGYSYNRGRGGRGRGGGPIQAYNSGYRGNSSRGGFSRGRGRGSNRGGTRFSKPFQKDTPEGICWYHCNFGSKATYCGRYKNPPEPCLFPVDHTKMQLN